jgi:3',5'-cyclic-AMP phosphodiesterase
MDVCFYAIQTSQTTNKVVLNVKKSVYLLEKPKCHRTNLKPKIGAGQLHVRVLDFGNQNHVLEFGSMSLRLAIITDLHYGRDTGNVRGPAALEILERIQKHIHTLEPDLVLELGDRLTDENTDIDHQNLLELARVFKRLPYQRHHISGNHDLLPKAEQEAILETNLGSHSVEKHGWHLIFLETSNGSPAGTLSSDTLIWLEQELNRATLPVVVFSHQPLHGQPMIGNPYFETEYASFAFPKNHEKARKILEDSRKVKICVSGHAHWFDKRNVGGIDYITLLGPTETQWTNGTPPETWAMLELNGNPKLEVFGAMPQTLSW